MSRVAALYVDPKGVYLGLDGVEVWDEARDARLYSGPWPVVAHPPCSTWCQLARVNEARYGHKVGDDGGCFETALDIVNEFGGVLEHPAESIAFRAFGILRPHPGSWQRSIQGYWITEVNQSAYGHRARKRTWLYYVGRPMRGRHFTPPPSLDWSDPEPRAWVSYMTNHGDTSLPRLSKREAKATPILFRDLLLSMARSVRQEEVE